MKVVEIGIEGVAPLLMHRFATDRTERGKGPRNPNYEAPEMVKKELRDALYVNGDGKTLAQPSEMLEAALVKAAKEFKFEGKKTYKDPVRAGVFVEPYEVLHKHQKWEDFPKRVVIQGRSIIRHRPMLKEWALDFQCCVTDERINLEDLRSMWDYAGAYKGLGDWRPKFGRFKVVAWKVKEGK